LKQAEWNLATWQSNKETNLAVGFDVKREAGVNLSQLGKQHVIGKINQVL